ncbi:MAG: hypothetical protein AMXMBFR13_39080 [Phycisphaerae bacterium]
MDCLTAKENLGLFVDGELAGTQRTALREHVAGCESCLIELSRLHWLIHRLRSLSEAPEIKAPPDLWPKIEQRLNTPSSKTAAGTRTIAFFRRPAAAAAAVALLIGAGLFMSLWPMAGPQTARAESIDYDVLLDRLSSGPESAFLRFLDHYQAQAITADAARSAAPQLGFSLPPRLPSGHQLERVYKLRFGTSPGIAARYVSGRQPLFVFFHPPTDREHTGKYQEQPCLVGDYHGRQVEIGPWRLVHVTDSATCRCILTTLVLESQLPPILKAVTPDSEAR